MAWSLTRILKLIAFYGVFYSILAGFFGVMFVIFIKTLDDKQPKRQLEDSLIGNIPALDLHPTTFDGIIRYRAGDLTSSTHWVKQLNEFLSPYQSDRNKSKNVQNCYLTNDPEANKVCDFKLTSELAPCLPQYFYGFDSLKGGPCIFLKLNKVFGWVPDFYHRNNVPLRMPHELVEKIKAAELVNEQYKIWVDCVPVDSTQLDALGPISYYPQQGFDGRYFPYRNLEGYLSPLVAVHFHEPKPYEEQTKYENIDNCEGKDKPDDKKFCEFAFNHEFAPCIKDFGYGFGNKQGGGPCIFLKLNKIYGWTPVYYTNATAPSNMPRHLRDQIVRTELLGQHHLVWVDCAGKNLADIENIGAVSYYPQRGFQEKYFPFQNVDGYISPFVAVHFENPKRGTLINIECKAWARNIHHDRVNRRGSVHFKLLVD